MNVTQKMIDHADVIVSFKTYPHVDMVETGEHGARATRPAPRPCAAVLAWRQPPLMTSTLLSASAEGAMRRAVKAARAAEADGMLAVSVLPGFSLADIPAPCISVVVVADGDRAAADAVAERIARQIWDARDDFVYRSAPLAESVAQAATLAHGTDRPVLMLDHGDNCMSGGPCDTMDLLEAALAHADGIVSGPLCDPQAVAALIDAGVGATVTVSVGNRLPSHGGVRREPFRATGVVRALTDGEYVITGYTGQRAYMGRTAVLDIGAATLVITERTQEPWDLGVFESVGVDPRRARFLLLKSRMYCRPVFVPIAAALVECDSRGVTGSDYGCSVTSGWRGRVSARRGGRMVVVRRAPDGVTETDRARNAGFAGFRASCDGTDPSSSRVDAIHCVRNRSGESTDMHSNPFRPRSARLLAALTLATTAVAAHAADWIVSGNDGKYQRVEGRDTFLASPPADTLTLLDASTFPPKVALQVDVENGIQGPQVVAITPDAKLALVGAPTRRAAKQLVFDTFLQVVNLDAAPPSITRIELGTHPQGIAIDRSGKLALVANVDGSVSILRIDGTNVTLDGNLKIGKKRLAGISFTHDGKHALVRCATSRASRC